ncbi:TetR family transcriptional regulator [Kribbella sp. NPDC051770]|uniref:TetR family transcriptional regulator n=1 Tax=Kribbella sp. NPDC051770 TaxID=3155413 RepID=UPI003449600B
MTGLRDRARRAVRAEVAGVGFTLFAEHGFDQVTADQIAAAAGMSRTSFFRYFPTKEDVVLGHLEEMGEQLTAALAARPADEGAWVALEQAFFDQFGETLEDPDRALRLARMMQDTPSLRARHLEKQQNWQDLLTPEVARRLRITDTPTDPRPRAVAGAALACLDAANQAWTNSNGTKDMRELITQAMSVL